MVKIIKTKTNLNSRNEKTKNKTKKNNLRIILLDGTSTAGKSTICNLFTNYKCFPIDDYWDDSRISSIFEYMKTVSNRYNQMNLRNEKVVKLLINDGLKTKKNFIIDHISQSDVINVLKAKKLLKNLFIIVVYANFDTLVRNFENRRKKGDAREAFVFEQFAERYVATNSNDKHKIDIVNRKKFKSLLVNNLKYLFTDQDKLITFSNDIFRKMNINDDKDHWIKLRDGYKCDYLLNTSNKTKEEIFTELNKIL